MKIYVTNKIVFLLLAASGLTACQNSPNTTTVAVNGNQTNISSNVPLVGNVNVIVNANANSANANLMTGESVGIEAREPEQYQAKVVFKVETGGAEKSAAFPPIAATVARSGNDKRMELTMPNGEKIIYLDRSGQLLLVSPKRKQYAELNRESLGFDVRRLLLPEQIVKQVKNIKGVERVGEDKFGSRDVIKYRYNSTTETKSQAGSVSTEAVVLVDKETGLPLRSETFAQSQTGAVSGMNSLRLVTEMSDLQMNADPALFAEPTDFKKVAPEELRGQVDALFKLAGAFLQQMMSNQQNNQQNNQQMNNQAPVNSPTTP